VARGVHKLGRARRMARIAAGSSLCIPREMRAAKPPASRISDPLATMVARLTFVAETAGRLSSAAALVPRPTLVPELAGRLIGEGRARGGQGEQAGE
jgi:hypothetical protein